MNRSSARTFAAWFLLVLGLLATAAPLLAWFLLFEQSQPTLVDSVETDYGVSTTYEWSSTTLYVGPWIPTAGGLLMLAGALILMRKSGTA